MRASGIKTAPPGHHTSPEDRRAEALARKIAGWEAKGKPLHHPTCKCGLPEEHRKT